MAWLVTGPIEEISLAIRREKRNGAFLGGHLTVM